jgi:hypothetical protein
MRDRPNGSSSIPSYEGEGIGLNLVLDAVFRTGLGKIFSMSHCSRGPGLLALADLYALANPNSGDRCSGVVYNWTSSSWGIIHPKASPSKIKTPCTHVILCICFFLVEPKTRITQFLIHLNLLKLYPFLCIDSTMEYTLYLHGFLSTWPNIPVHVNLWRLYIQVLRVHLSGTELSPQI